LGNSCKSCNKSFDREVNFCTQCGKALSKHIDEEKISTINLIISFYVTFLVFALISFYISENYSNSLTKEIISETLFAGIIIGFSFLDYKNILKLYVLPNINWKIWIFAFIFPVVSSASVYYFVEISNTFFFVEESFNYYIAYINLDYPLFWAILFIAILPPIFEELAFRGFLFNQLQKVASTKVTIIATAFLFALIHLSFISIIWIFPFGILLGYLRSKFNTLWLGMIIHFTHNLIIVLIDYTVA
jgi:membrane protease YdiL (CAAX protease family)